jgi:hypothetical protein
MERIKKLSGMMFLVTGALMMIVCISGIVSIIGSGFSPGVISFFETEITPVVRILPF